MNCQIHSVKFKLQSQSTKTWKKVECSLVQIRVRSNREPSIVMRLVISMPINRLQTNFRALALIAKEIVAQIVLSRIRVKMVRGIYPT